MKKRELWYKRVGTLAAMLLTLPTAPMCVAGAVEQVPNQALYDAQLLETEVQDGTGEYAALTDEGMDDFIENVPAHDGYLFRLKEQPADAVQLFSVLPEDSREVIEDLQIYHTNSLSEIASLMEMGLIEYIEPNQQVQLFDLPNDPLYTAGDQWLPSFMKMEAAWELGLTGKGVRIGIIDSGITRTHEDLKGADIDIGQNFLYTLSNNKTDTTDTYSHGTFVSGVIAAQHNGVGLAGVAPGATIVPVRFIGKRNGVTVGGSIDSLVSALEWAATDGACDIINVSAGTIGNSPSLKWVIEAIHQKTNAIIVAAVGNESRPNGTLATRYQYPAAYPSVIGVGSLGMVLDGYDAQMNLNYVPKVSYYSQRNDSVFVTAPGENVWGLKHNDDSQYYLSSGTSFSSPAVAGALALILERNTALGRDKITAEQMMEYIKASADDMGEPGYDTNYGWGSFNMEKMLATVFGAQPQEPTDQIPSTGDGEQPTDPPASGGDEQQPTDQTPSTGDGEQPTDPPASGGDEQQPTDQTPSTGDGEQPVDPPSSGDGEQPTDQTPSTGDGEQQQPVDPPSSGDGEQQPTDQTPSTGGGEQEPTDQTPSTGGDEQQPTDQIPSTGDGEQQQPVDPPSSGDDTQQPPVDPPASGGGEQQPTDQIPSTGDGEQQQPVDPPSSGDDTQQPTDQTPPTGDGERPTDQTPSTGNGEQQPTDQTPPTGDGEQPTDPPASGGDEQQPTDQTPSTGDGEQQPTDPSAPTTLGDNEFDWRLDKQTNILTIKSGKLSGISELDVVRIIFYDRDGRLVGTKQLALSTLPQGTDCYLHENMVTVSDRVVLAKLIFVAYEGKRPLRTSELWENSAI